MRYHDSSAGVAPSRTDPRSAAFVEGLRLCARCLLYSVPSLSEGERQFLKDIAREEYRVQLVQLQRLIRLSQRSQRSAHREQLAELVRAHSLPVEPARDLIAASDLETQAQGPADVAVRELEHHPSPATKARAAEALREHHARIRELLDAVEAHPVQ